MGTNNKTLPEDFKNLENVLEFTKENVIIHPDWLYVSRINDIAIIKLTRPIKMKNGLIEKVTIPKFFKQGNDLDSVYCNLQEH